MAELAPILVVEDIEPCIEFWRRLGFEKTVEVPKGNRLGLVMLNRGGIDVIYHSKASLAGDAPHLGGHGERSIIYLRVDNLEDIEEKMTGIEPVAAMEQTSYGGAELAYADPAGNIIIFAMESGY